ncbi:MAG TPA: hypothetical protein DF364_08360 [Ruminococcaceae bacterium]|nr:hypothetical protein [Oscillospiraceae bacterium]
MFFSIPQESTKGKKEIEKRKNSPKTKPYFATTHRKEALYSKPVKYAADKKGFLREYCRNFVKI